MGEDCAWQVQRLSGRREPGTFQNQPGDQCGWNGVGTGKSVGDGQRGGRWADHAVTQTGFLPPAPSCNWRRRKKNKPISRCRNLCRESNGQSRTSHAVPKAKHLQSGGPATKIRKGNSVIIWSTECTIFPPAVGFLHS